MINKQISLLPLWDLATSRNNARIQLEEINEAIDRWFNKQLDNGLLSESDIEELKQNISTDEE